MPDVLRASTVVTSDGVLEPGEVVVDAGTVVAVRPVPDGARASVPDRILCPGFVDLQVNGMDDVDCAAARSDADWARIGDLLSSSGVTSWCPTLVTAPLDAYPARIARVREAMARQLAPATAPTLVPSILGVHLEGPFLGGAPGAHPREWLAPIDLDWLRALPLGDVVRVVTLSPELAGATDAIALLASRGVLVSVGHSTATYEQAGAAADAGARLVTHLFNGMGPLHHRAPGLVGAALSDDRLAPSLIADGVHVHPAALRAAARAKGSGGWVLVTDAVAWRSWRLAGREVTVRDGGPRLPDGTLAGSSLTMDAALRRMVHECGIPLPDAVAAASTTPARLVGAADRGALAAGRRADVVTLSPDLDVIDVTIA
ncbi:MAG TPA: N-acetylglucosamine-6-phosphate deacetylase [Acidimicrobiales bacterium]